MREARLVWMFLAVVAPPLTAQEDSRLGAAVRLAQDGRGDSARAIVLDLLSRVPISDTLYPQVVYTMGLVARDAADRSRNFRRIAVEFAGSAWADDALLGLAQEDFAAGRAEASALNLERIRSDYPSSPLLPVASYWAARVYFELRRPAEACRWLAQGSALAGEDVELLNQMNFYAPRCAAGATEPTARFPVPPPEPAMQGPAFAVQVAAAASEAAASGTVTSLQEAGYEPRLVRHGGFVKVRVGRFASRAEASAAASQIRARLGGSPFVVEEP